MRVCTGGNELGISSFAVIYGTETAVLTAVASTAINDAGPETLTPSFTAGRQMAGPWNKHPGKYMLIRTSYLTVKPSRDK